MENLNLHVYYQLTHHINNFFLYEILKGTMNMYENYVGQYIEPEKGIEKNVYKNAPIMQIVEISKTSNNEEIFKCRNAGKEEFYNHITVSEVHSYFRRLNNDETKNLPNFIKKDSLIESNISVTENAAKPRRRSRP